MDGFTVDQITIRFVETADAPTIAALWTDLVAYHQSLDSALPTSAPNGAGRYAKRLLQHLDDNNTCALVAEVDGKIIGYVLGMIVDLLPDIFAEQPGGFLADIYVEAAYRRKGVGRALVRELQDWFREKGVTHFDWHVAAQNADGLAFWRSVGGREVMIRMRAQLGENHD
jgi:ribosomal protein S18 acetylase RimI-like enzyme